MIRPGASARGVRKGKRPPPPKGPELAYEAALRRYSGEISKAVRAAVKRPLATLRAEQRSDAKDFASLDFGLLRVRLGRIAAGEASDLVDRYGSRITNWNRSTLSEILGIPVRAQTPEVQAALARFQRENVDLITSIHERLLDDVESVVSEATARGTRVETLAARLAERYGVSDSRAELIARDQTLKFNASLTQIRFAEAGVTRYVWSSSRDERVRPFHAALEGRVFSFDDPPVTNEAGDTNNPGTDFQCRCTAIPVLDEVSNPDQAFGTGPRDVTAPAPEDSAARTARRIETQTESPEGFQIWAPARPGAAPFPGNWRKSRDAAEQYAERLRTQGFADVSVRPGPRSLR